jgi:hypothetical protein
VEVGEEVGQFSVFWEGIGKEDDSVGCQIFRQAGLRGVANVSWNKKPEMSIVQYPTAPKIKNLFQ